MKAVNFSLDEFKYKDKEKLLNFFFFLSSHTVLGIF